MRPSESALGAISACPYGNSAGHWSEGLEWRLNKSATCPSPLPRYLRLRKSCLTGNGKTTLARCVDVDHVALAPLQNASLLFFGDSTAYRMVDNLCSVFQAKVRSTIQFPAINRSSPFYLRAYKDGSHKRDHHFCRLLTGNVGRVETADGPLQQLGLPVGVHTHYGVAGEPYWAHAYPRPPWLGRTTEAMARKDLPTFCTQTLGCEPTLVVLNSAYWELSAWWFHAGNATRRSCYKAPNRVVVNVSEHHIRSYIGGLRSTLAALRHAFPSSVFAWRTAHPGLGHGITRAATQRLNQAVIAHAPSLGLRVIDVGGMIEQLTPRSYLLGPALDAHGDMKKGTRAAGRFVSGTTDGRHLHPYLNAEVFNLVLAELGHAWRAQSAAVRYPACRTKPRTRQARLGTSADQHAPAPPGHMCATHAMYRAIPTSAELYAPLPSGECASPGCSTMHCLCKKHDRNCTSTGHGAVET